ncbi:hypothetical protein ACQKMD_01190 [Viridibacillus sp. NPDC096237]|uniref:hypothetical protein n=1 Tax=Viridibacillus sp. NPDC096237 TaxID=3390721 RepID=UPI003D02CB26
MEDCSKVKPDEFYKEKLREQYSTWLPVIAGIATREEVEMMTADQLGIACEAANMKIKLFGGGG